MTNPVIRRADLANPGEAAAVVAIIDSYARGPGGQNAPLSNPARDAMCDGLRKSPNTEVWLAFLEDQAVGVAVCIRGFSTFVGQPMVNIHDLAVLPDHRGRGIGRSLMRAIEAEARESGCCKVTLEVLSDNESAQRLYVSEGFGPIENPTLFLTKPLT